MPGLVTVAQLVTDHTKKSINIAHKSEKEDLPE